MMENILVSSKIGEQLRHNGYHAKKMLKEKMEIILVSILTNTSSNKLTSVYLMFHLTVFLWSK